MFTFHVASYEIKLYPLTNYSATLMFEIWLQRLWNLQYQKNRNISDISGGELIYGHFLWKLKQLGSTWEIANRFTKYIKFCEFSFLSMHRHQHFENVYIFVTIESVYKSINSNIAHEYLNPLDAHIYCRLAQFGPNRESTTSI